MTKNVPTSITAQDIQAVVNATDTGDYRADCATGRRLADKLINAMAATGGTPMLGTICKGIIDAGRWKTVHVGFFQRLADRCVSEPS